MRAAILVLLGLAAGFVGAILQTFVVWLGDVALPVGGAAVLVTLAMLARATAWWVRSRWGAIVFSVSWLVATLVMSSTTSGGDLVLTSGTRQIAYLILGSMLLAFACGFPLLPADDDGPGPVPVPAGADEDTG